MFTTFSQYFHDKNINDRLLLTNIDKQKIIATINSNKNQ